MPVRQCFVAPSVIGLVLLLICGSKGVAADQNQSPGRKLAFLVGIREYKHLDFKDLDFPENDVEDFAAVLKAHGFKTVLLTTARGKKDPALTPTAENIRAQLKSLLTDVSKHDLIIVGLAGHGIQPLESDESYFCPMDSNPTLENGRLVDPSRLISLGELLGQLRQSGVGEKLVLVDACRNDPSVRGRRGVDHVNVSALPAQTGMLLSCSQGEFSFENKSLGKGHGAFFYHVIEGFKGAAKNQEGAVTWDSLRTYVKTEVPATVQTLFGKDGGEQNPNEIGNLRGRPPVLARIDRGSPRPDSPAEPSTPKTAPPEKSPHDSQDREWVKQAEHLLEIGNYEELEKLAAQRLSQDPQSATALTYHAAVLSNNDRNDDALDTINKAIRLDPGICRAYGVRGRVYFAKADFDLAIRDFTEAIRMAPEPAVYYVDRGFCYDSTQSWSEALADANQALQANSENPTAYLLRAVAKAGAAGMPGGALSPAVAMDVRDAFRLYQKQVDADKEDRVALLGLSDTYSWNQEGAKSLEILNKVIRRGWGTAATYYARGARYFDIDQYKWAIADFSKAIQMNPRHFRAFEQRASCYNTLKRYDDAIRDATESIRINPKYADAYVTRGVAYSWKSEFEGAKADYQQALRIDPKHQSALDNLQKIK